MIFDSAAGAVAFAEEVLSRPVITSASQVLEKVPGRGVDVDVVRDTAHTISAKLAEIEQSDAPAAGKVFRCVFGAGDNEQMMRATMELARELLSDENVVEAMSLPDYQVRAMILACLKEARRIERGQGTRSYARIGRLLGYDDARKFRRKHGQAVSTVRESIERSIQVAEYRLEYALKAAGLMPE